MTKPIRWLITGSRGYVGRHLTSRLLREGVDYVGLDKETSHSLSERDKNIECIGDYLDQKFVRTLFENNEITGLVHLAALKDVTEAIENPTLYLESNLEGSISLLNLMEEHNVKKIVFASSAAVYGDQNTHNGFKESDKTIPSNAYGKSKLEFENYLFANGSSLGLSTISLRFFNIGGAERDLLPDLNGSNLIPKLIDSALGKSVFSIFGGAFPTKDGTAERDFVHISDVVDAILKAMNHVATSTGSEIVNVGSGQATSVQTALQEVSDFLNTQIFSEVSQPREGDAYSSFADISTARVLLNWEPKKVFSEIINSYTNHVT